MQGSLKRKVPDIIASRQKAKRFQTLEPLTPRTLGSFPSKSQEMN